MSFSDRQIPNSQSLVLEQVAPYPFRPLFTQEAVSSVEVAVAAHVSSTVRVVSSLSAQVHVYESTACAQAEPCKHGDEAHSSMSVAQFSPSHPAAQVVSVRIEWKHRRDCCWRNGGCVPR